MTYVYIQVYQEAHRLSKLEDRGDQTSIQLNSVTSISPHDPFQKNHQNIQNQSFQESR